METINFPSFTESFSPSRSMFVFTPNTEMSVSSVNNSQSIIENAGTILVVRYNFKIIERDDGLDLRGTLNALRGHSKATQLVDPKFKAQRGSWSGTPVVDGNGIYGMSLPVRGLAANQLIGKRCDRFRLFEQLYELVADATTDATGRCVLKLVNEIRQPVNDGDALITDPTGLYGVCRWSNPSQIEQLEGNYRLYRNVSLDFMEYL